MTTNTKQTVKQSLTVEQPAQIPDAFDRLMREADKPTQVSEQIAKYVAALVQGTHEITSVTIRPKPAQQQEPVAWVGSLKDPQPHCVTDLKYCSVAQWDTGYHLKYIPLYTSPPANANAGKPWVGLTRDEIADLAEHYYDDKVVQVEEVIEMAEAKLRERNEHWEKNA